MKQVKLFSMTLLLWLAIVMPGNLQAQSKQVNPEDRAKKETADMKEKLNLTEDQTQKVGAINLKYAQLMADMHKQNGQGSEADQQANREKMKGLHDKKVEELKLILTPAQMDQYKKMQEEKRNEHMKHQ